MPWGIAENHEEELCRLEQRLREEFATALAESTRAREQAEKHREEDLASFIRTNQACVLERDAEEERADQAERERGTALARAKEAEGDRDFFDVERMKVVEQLTAAESAVASAREIVGKAPVPDPDGEGVTLGECDTAFAVLDELRDLLTSHPAPVAVPCAGCAAARELADAIEEESMRTGSGDVFDVAERLRAVLRGR